MIQHHNPNDWKDWDKSMSRYQQKLERNARAFKWFVLVLTVAFVACWVIYGLHQVGSHPRLSVEEQLNDMLFKDHSEIPEVREEEYLRLFYNTAVALPVEIELPMASVQEICIRNKNNVQAAIDEISAMEQVTATN